MTVGDLKKMLDDYDEDVEVRVAVQPAWPFEHAIESVVALPVEDDAEFVDCVYIGVGEQLGYLPGVAAVALGWR